MPERTRSRPANGPARNTPKPATDPTPPPDPAICHCQPVTVATFRAEQLVTVEKRHLRAQGCARPPEPVDIHDYQASIRGPR